MVSPLLKNNGWLTKGSVGETGACRVHVGTILVYDSAGKIDKYCKGKYISMATIFAYWKVGWAACTSDPSN